MTAQAATTRRWASRHGVLALALWAITIGLATIATINDPQETEPIELVWRASIIVMASVGAVVGSRVPRNPIGWIFLGVALFAGLQGGLALVATASPSPTIGQVTEWVGHWAWIPMIFIPVFFVLLLFPDGRVLSPRWRLFPWLAALGIIGFSASTAFGEFAGGSAEYGPNPYFLKDLAAVVQLVGIVSGVLLLVAMTASVASVTVRFHRARGIERQQLKWLAYGAVITAASALIGILLWVLNLDIDLDIVNATVLTGPMVIPAAIGVALLKYRLYDIDRLINRTIVYVLVTAILFAVYAGLAVGLPQLLPISLSSDLATAGATLVVAALFRPASHRIQSFVDRRFYRLRYDAREILESFSGRLGHQLDLKALAGELGAVIGDTMHPAHVTLWLRERPMGHRA